MANGMNGGFTRDLDTNALLVTGSVTAAGGLTDTELRATPVPVSGTVTATGPLTDTQLRATPVPVSGTVTATGPLTDTQLRAASVPVLSAPQTGAVYSGTSALTPKFAFVNIAASQTNASVVALVASKKIRRPTSRASSPTAPTAAPRWRSTRAAGSRLWLARR